MTTAKELIESTLIEAKLPNVVLSKEDRDWSVTEARELVQKLKEEYRAIMTIVKAIRSNNQVLASSITLKKLHIDTRERFPRDSWAWLGIDQLS